MKPAESTQAGDRSRLSQPAQDARDQSPSNRLHDVSTTRVDSRGLAGNRADSIRDFNLRTLNALRPQLARRQVVTPTR
jgi:hypothetical protein